MKYEFGSTGEMTITWENGSSLRKTCLNAVCPPQIPHGLAPRSNAGLCDERPTNSQ